MKSVLLVSKPVAPPFHDGTKCLVRDIATHLERVVPYVMSVPGAPELSPAPGMLAPRLTPVYKQPGAFAPGLLQNLRAAGFLLFQRQHKLWHFVFAPNARTSGMGRKLSRLAGAKVVQTIASPPHSFAGVHRLLFGDVVVAQSRHTEQQLLADYAKNGGPAPRIAVIPPPVPELVPIPIEARKQVRYELSIPRDAPLFVYPGDLETSSGARRTAELVEPLVRELPDAVVVFAYRQKTPRAAGIAQDLEQKLPPNSVRFAGALKSVLPLLADSTAVLFPVDDLTGKVDLPIVLLEAMLLDVPIVAYRNGPLEDLKGVRFVDPGALPELLLAALELARSSAYRERVTAEQRRYVTERHPARVVASQYESIYEELLSR